MRADHPGLRQVDPVALPAVADPGLPAQEEDVFVQLLVVVVVIVGGGDGEVGAEQDDAAADLAELPVLLLRGPEDGGGLSQERAPAVGVLGLAEPVEGGVGGAQEGLVQVVAGAVDGAEGRVRVALGLGRIANVLLLPVVVNLF